MLFFVEGRPRSPPGDYCRIIPPKESRRRGGPPVLPPQLLQIVLNQEVPRHVSFTQFGVFLTAFLPANID